MAHLSGIRSGIRIGTTAWALAAALTLGSTVLTLSTVPTAYAARNVSSEPADPDAGPRHPATRPATGTATRKNINGYPKCTITGADGHVDFYLPGDQITRDGHILICGTDGQWFVFGRASSGDPTSVGGGGVATQAP